MAADDMSPDLQKELRRFVSSEHIKNVLAGEWVEMYNDAGSVLPGIRGRVGVSAPGLDGTHIGLDFMELKPSSEFPLHTHAGDHILYILSGIGTAHVDGVDYKLSTGDTIFVAAEQPHAFRANVDLKEPWRILALGHPHKHLSAKDRMKRVVEF